MNACLRSAVCRTERRRTGAARQLFHLDGARISYVMCISVYDAHLHSAGTASVATLRLLVSPPPTMWGTCQLGLAEQRITCPVFTYFLTFSILQDCNTNCHLQVVHCPLLYLAQQGDD